MKTILHLGTHRTASTCFQYYLRENHATLRDQGIAVWGPRQTRDGLLTGVIPISGTGRGSSDQLRRARGRIGLAQHRARVQGMQQLIVSEENMIGAPRRNLKDRRLYADIGERVARFADAFGHRIDGVVLSIRAQDMYWSSVWAFAVARGHKLPDRDELDRLVTSSRHWRDVIGDLACALPGVDLKIMPYEQFGGRPERILQEMTGLPNPPMKHAREWINRSPSLAQLRQVLRDRGQDCAQLPAGEGRWQPFDTEQQHALRECYADDMYWLRAGADGLATLIEETGTDKAGKTLLAAQMTRGQDNGIENRRMA